MRLCHNPHPQTRKRSHLVNLKRKCWSGCCLGQWATWNLGGTFCLQEGMRTVWSSRRVRRLNKYTSGNLPGIIEGLGQNKIFCHFQHFIWKRVPCRYLENEGKHCTRSPVMIQRKNEVKHFLQEVFCSVSLKYPEQGPWHIWVVNKICMCFPHLVSSVPWGW